MSNFPRLTIDNQWVLRHRGAKNKVDPGLPYHFFVEQEYIREGRIGDFAVILLTNRECPFRCVMCDLWKNTTDEPVRPGNIPDQIDYALSRLPPAGNIKLYNSGSFFDPWAIPPEDFPEIARLAGCFETVIVESHPVFIGESTLRFRDLLKTDLQVAIGLETVHPDVLERLNKKMKPDDFEKSVRFLNHQGVTTRAFILLRPPFLSEEEGIQWAKRSIDFAFASGAAACSVIPVRTGNGALEELSATGHFSQPDLRSLETVVEYGIGLGSGPVFADLWDIGRFSSCERCQEQRIARLGEMNLDQIVRPQIHCTCSG